MWGEGEGQVNDRIVQPRGGEVKNTLILRSKNRKLEAVGLKVKSGLGSEDGHPSLIPSVNQEPLCASVSHLVKG